PSPLAASSLRRQTPKVGAVCLNRARTDLCGGRPAMGVPTAIRIRPWQLATWNDAKIEPSFGCGDSIMNTKNQNDLSKFLEAIAKAVGKDEGQIFYEFMKLIHPSAPHDQKRINIGVLSIRSLFIEAKFNDKILACGTGFFVHTSAGTLLFTARHNLTGRHHATGKLLSKTCGQPNKLTVIYHTNNDSMIHVDMPLYNTEEIDSENFLWMEHPILGDRADVAALRFPLPLPSPEFAYDIKPVSSIYAEKDSKKINLNKGNFPLRVSVPDRVSVIGFPFAIRDAGSLPVYATGFIATEMEVPYSNLPMFLIDSRARRGQSGSPVVAIVNAGASVPIDSAEYKMAAFEGSASRLLGLYSGRVNDESDLGFVWKTSLLLEMVEDCEQRMSKEAGNEPPELPNYGDTELR
ncbi:hypothetical protein, partial [Inquilinus sp. CA228]|uniref:hypothetical protein n=1 Tax=Inquilinus sp. CA228 TaxID=3455609 RepID=UPI003F8D125E